MKEFEQFLANCDIERNYILSREGGMIVITGKLQPTRRIEWALSDIEGFKKVLNHAMQKDTALLDVLL